MFGQVLQNPQPNASADLKKVLKAPHFWAIAVGTVITGNYYGFSYGLAFGGPVSFLLAFLLVSIFYITFVHCYAELATAFPSAGGASVFAGRAMGAFAGYLTGFSVLVSFLIAPCAIAITTGDLTHFLFPWIPARAASIVLFCLFIFLSLFSVESSTKLQVVISVISILGLLLYAGIALPYFEPSRYLTRPLLKNEFPGIAGAMTFAMWFYFGIDCAAMSAEEMVNPARDIPKGFRAAVYTLFAVAFIAVVLPAGIADYQEIASVNFPLACSLKLVLGEQNPWSTVFAAIALVSLLAGFVGTILAYSRQCFSMARDGYFPHFLTKTNHNGVPYHALLLPSAIAIVLTLFGDVDLCIAISVFAALVEYITVIFSLFQLRKEETALCRPYRVRLFFPVTALLTGILLAVCVIGTNLSVAPWFLLLYGAATLFYVLYSKKHVDMN